jgi:hypothetical protein
LDAFIDDAVDYTKSVEVQLNALLGAIGDLQVLGVEVVEELELLVSERRTEAGHYLTAGP